MPGPKLPIGSSGSRSARRDLLLGLALASIARIRAAHARGTDALTPAQWLDRIRAAALDRSYQGTTTFSAGGTVSSARLAHYCDGAERYERVEGLDGRRRLQYRHNDQVVTLWPGGRVAVIEHYDAVPDFPELPAPAPHTWEHYGLRHGGIDRVCGLGADILLLNALDGQRFSQRLWVERETGLMLRADVVDARGRVLETSAFSEVALAPRIRPRTVLAPMRKLDGYRIVHPPVVKTRLDAEGWTLARPVPGFDLVGCTRRPLDALAQPASPPVLQAMFCDGLAQVSLFIEPFDELRHQPMRSVSGATHTAMSRHGAWWLTIMGEVPMATVKLFDAALDRRG